MTEQHVERRDRSGRRLIGDMVEPIVEEAAHHRIDIGAADEKKAGRPKDAPEFGESPRCFVVMEVLDCVRRPDRVDRGRGDRSRHIDGRADDFGLHVRIDVEAYFFPRAGVPENGMQTMRRRPPATDMKDAAADRSLGLIRCQCGEGQCPVPASISKPHYGLRAAPLSFATSDIGECRAKAPAQIGSDGSRRKSEAQL